MGFSSVLLLATWSLLLTIVLTQEVIWSEEFNSEGRSAPDGNTWGYDIGDWGWGNNEYQAYTSNLENAYVEDGNLKITAIRNGDSFTSARLKTDDKVFVKYGTIEARIKIPNVENGLWPAFWTMGQNFQAVGWPFAGEIDVMEIGDGHAIDQGVANNRVVSAVHWERNEEFFYDYYWATAPYRLDGSYHSYKLEWTPDFVRMWVDDIQIHYYNINLDSCNDCEELHQPHYLILNLAVGGDFTYRPGEPWGAARITAEMPATMEVDWIRVYDNGFTQISGPGVTGEGPADQASPETASPTPMSVSPPSQQPTPPSANPPTSAPTTPQTNVPMNPPATAPPTPTTVSLPTRQPTPPPTNPPSSAPTEASTTSEMNPPTGAPTRRGTPAPSEAIPDTADIGPEDGTEEESESPSQSSGCELSKLLSGMVLFVAGILAAANFY